MTRRRVSNPLALAVLSCLAERPMHPYEISTTLRSAARRRASSSTTARCTRSSTRSRSTGSSRPRRPSATAAGPSARSTRSPTGRLQRVRGLARRAARHVPSKRVHLARGRAVADAGLRPGEVARLLEERVGRLTIELRVGTRARSTSPASRASRDMFLVEGAAARRDAGGRARVRRAARPRHPLRRAARRHDVWRRLHELLAAGIRRGDLRGPGALPRGGGTSAGRPTDRQHRPARPTAPARQHRAWA